MQTVQPTSSRLPGGLDSLERRGRNEAAARSESGRLAREFRDEVRQGDGERARWSLFGRGWVFWLVTDLGLLALPVPFVVMMPPVLECRHISETVGFYAGGSFKACAREGIAKRWSLLDSRIKMLIRQSGR